MNQKTFIDYIRNYKLTSDDFNYLKDHFKELDEDDIGEYKGQTITQLVNESSPEGFEEETEFHIINCLLGNIIEYYN